MSDRGPLNAVASADRFGRAIETFLLALTLGAMIMLAAAQIVLRNFGSGGIDWADEALRLLVLWVAMLGAVAASREQRHVSIDALSRYLPRGMHPWTSFLVEVFTAGVCLALAWFSWLFVADSRMAEDMVLGGRVPAWTVQSILPMGFFLMGYRYTFSSVRRVLRHRAGATRS